jgi:hypothetical protein
VGGADYPLKSSPYLTNPFRSYDMSDAPKTRPKVPEGKSRFLTTTQMEANEKGYVGYKTTWEAFQKEVPYQTPKKP